MRSSIQFVREVEGTMAIEGLKLKKHEIDLLFRCASGERSSKDIVNDLISKYTQKKGL
ncbi:hypothetical protein [Clostridium sp. JN-9]|uniref:hypothetical protein n=1 Tax=Clostridium sp. JN-9 TaxID=2507159 RepID=UPI0013E8E630|nr:hypothetical protein [Clostridium sp. JN-9]